MNDRIWLKLLSILLGIFAWIYVNLVMPPQIRRNLIAEIEYRNAPEMMKITPQRPTVQIQVEGSRRDFILSGDNKVQVTVDLYNLRPGRAQLPVRVTAAPGLSVVSVNPPQIHLEAITLLRKKFDVKAQIIGQPAEGYLADDPRITPDKILLEGPETLINRVATCQVDIGLELVKNSVSEQKPVKVMLDTGVVNDEIIATPAKVTVDVTVKQGYPTRLIPLAKPVFINKLPEGKKIDTFRIFPESVMLTGPAKLLNSMTDLSFNPVDLSRLEQASSMPLRLEMPDPRVRLLGSETPFIEISLSEVRVARLFEGLPFELKKTDKQYASVSVSSYTIEVEGLVKDLELVRNAALKMVLDVEKMKPGSYSVSLSAPAGLPEQVTVLNIVPESLNVSISELQNNVTGKASETIEASENDNKKHVTEDNNIASDASELNKKEF